MFKQIFQKLGLCHLKVNCIWYIFLTFIDLFDAKPVGTYPPKQFDWLHCARMQCFISNFFNTKLLFGEHLIEYIDLKLTATKIAVISEI